MLVILECGGGCSGHWTVEVAFNKEIGYKCETDLKTFFKIRSARNALISFTLITMHWGRDNLFGFSCRPKNMYSLHAQN